MAEAPEDNLMTANLFRIDDDEGDPIEMSWKLPGINNE